MDKRLLAALTLVALLAGALFAVFLFNRGGGSDRPAPPCPEGWEEAPESRCIRSTEACNAFLDGQARQTVRCTADSDDGRGLLRYAIAGGSGTAAVTVKDNVGRVLYARTVSMAAPLSDDDAVTGPRGTWTLEVAFDAQGSGRIFLYG
ncbi:MAG TPA: hypothetical protein VHH36_08625 [Candidatus Thermoplasmatota archaeon]|nr:hypothetical protein [Candidatus Thermoplasmatota archaeon]